MSLGNGRGGKHMRPIKIIVSAFGPYNSRTEIELSKFGKSGIFLVTGDTGAGKTSILMR